MSISPLAGKPAPKELVIDLAVFKREDYPDMEAEHLRVQRRLSTEAIAHLVVRKFHTEVITTEAPHSRRCRSAARALEDTSESTG